MMEHPRVTPMNRGVQGGATPIRVFEAAEVLILILTLTLTLTLNLNLNLNLTLIGRPQWTCPRRS